MPDKFAITAELHVRLASDVKKQIGALRKDCEKVELNVSLDKQQFDKDTRYIYASFRAISNTIKKNPFKTRFNTDLIDDDTKYIYTSYKQIKKTLEKNVIKTSFDRSRLDDDTKYIYASFKALKDSIERRLIDVKFNRANIDDDSKYILSSFRLLKTSIESRPINTGFNRQSVDNDIKYIMASMRSLLSSLNNKNSKVNINANIDPAFQQFQNTIGMISNKTIRVNVATQAKSLAKFTTLANNLNTLNAAVNSFDTAKLTLITDKLVTMSTSLRSLANLSKRSFAYNFTFKNLQRFDSLDLKLQKIDAGFIKAATSANNLLQVINQIAASIKSLGNVKINFGSTGGSTNGQNKLNHSIQETTNSIEELGRQTGITFRRFGAYTIATAGFFQLTFALKAATQEFLEYEKELTKVRQVTGQSLTTTELLSKQIGELATSYGVSSSSILNTSLVLAQAGYTAKEVGQALETLAKTELAATFEDIDRTVEGAIAAMAQFKYSTADLESVLSSVNSVSAKFAVESDDIITAIQKAGGAFASAGGNLNELQALFTAVRATTRESADTIATGFRTIFTRLQRVRTQEFLRDFGIDLNYTAEEAKEFGKTAGEFVGPYEAIRRLHTALKDIATTDPRYAQITEELGGFRQINKVIPLLQQFPKAVDVLNVAQKNNNSLTEDAIIAQESFANKLTKVREEFLLVIRELGSDKEIKTMINGFINLADALVNVLRYTKELIPAFATLGGLAAVPIGAQFLRGASSNILKKASGGYIHQGSGTQDDVQALLMKGEYVLNKRTVRKIGKDNLDKLNFQRFATGGSVGGSGRSMGATLTSTPALLGGLAIIPILEAQFGKLSDEVQNVAGALGAGLIGLKLFTIAVESSKNTINDLSGVKGKIRENVKERRAAREASVSASQDLANKEHQYRKVLAPGRRERLEKRFELESQNVTKYRDGYNQNMLNLTNATQRGMSQGYLLRQIRQGQRNRKLYGQSVRNRNQAQSNIFEQDTASSDLAETRRRVETANKRAVAARRRSDFIRTKNVAFKGVTRFGGGAAIGGAIGGQLLQDQADKRLEKIRENGGIGDISTAKGFAAGGGILSGAGTGAAIGGTLGLALGPAGAAIGAAAGAIVGGAVGFANASKEFESAIKSINVQKITDNLDSTLKSFTGGKTTASIATTGVVGNISNLQRTLQSESDPEVRKDILASLKNNSVQINQFVNDLAKSSGTVDNFNQRIDETTRRFIANIIGIPFEELSKQVKQQINDQNKSLKNASNLASARNEFESQIRSLIAMRQAFVYAESRVKNFGDTIENFLSETSGSTNATARFSEVSGLDAVPDLSKFTKDVGVFTAMFGAAGAQIGNVLTEGAQAFEQLPNILLDLKSQGSFADESDLTNSLENKLDTAGISGSIKRVILSKLPQVLGQDFKDSEFFKKLDEDFSGVMKTFTEGFSETVNLLKESAAKSAEQLNKFASGLDTLRAAEIKGIADNAGLKDFDARLIESRDTFTGERPSFDKLVGVQESKAAIITEGKTVAQLQAESLSARGNILNLENQRSQTASPVVEKGLIESINKEKLQIDKTTQSLKYLAENTGKLAVLQSKLNAAQGDRLKHKDFAIDSVFGDSQSRARQQQVLIATQIAASSGSVDGVDDSMKQEVLSMLRGFGDTKLPGMQISGTQAIDKILKNKGITADIIGPGKEETDIQAQIEAQIKQSADAQLALNNILAADRTAFSAAIHSEWTTFLSDLDKILNASIVNETKQKISSTQSTLQQKQKDLAFIQSTGMPAINNVDSIEATEKRLSELANTPEALTNNSKRFESMRKRLAAENESYGGLAETRVSFDDANNLFEQAFSNVSPDIMNRAIGNVQKSDIGLDYSNRTVGLTKLTAAIQAELQKEIQSAGAERSTLMNQKQELISNVGGDRQYANIAQNADKIQAGVAQLQSKDAQALTVEIGKLTQQMQELNAQKKVLGFNSGGIVPGSGNYDSVPARLTPGEGIITKQAMAKYGPGVVNALNKGTFPKNFASGGVVGGGISIDAESLSSLNSAVQSLSTQIDRLQAAFSSIPTEISMTGRHTVELIINGAQVLTQLQPEIVKLVESGAKDAINKMLKNKFPQVGSYNG